MRREGTHSKCPLRRIFFLGGTQRLPLAGAALRALVAGTLMVLSMRISIPVCAGSS
jgi:hypothetical protein